MAGLIWFAGLAVLALCMFGRASVLAGYDRALRTRLMPVQAKVTNPGTTPNTSIFVSTDSDGNRTERRDVDYQARYEYVVDGMTHVGTATSPAPVFRPEQIQYGRATVYYDAEDPAVSRVSNTAVDTTPRAFRLFGWVILAVGAAIAAISDLDWVLAALAE